MKKKWGIISVIISSVAFCILILDAKTALKGAQDGITLSLQSVIPSLFPFLLISLVFNAAIAGRRIPLLRPLCKLYGIAEGMESIILLGFLGGYPIGAQSINDSFVRGCISRRNAQRLLGFCNNAGPAFLFGIAGSLFAGTNAVWYLWAIHVVSALIVGMLLPVEDAVCKSHILTDPLPLPKALEKVVKIMAGICGWVIAFRVLIAFCRKWFLWLFPTSLQVVFCGILELTNGIHALTELPLYGQRFVIASFILAFGGVCVSMQTVHVTQDVGVGMYFPGKLMQAAISFLLAASIQHLIFTDEQIIQIPSWELLICAVLICLIGICLRIKKSCSITGRNVV